MASRRETSGRRSWSRTATRTATGKASPAPAASEERAALRRLCPYPERAERAERAGAPA